MNRSRSVSETSVGLFAFLDVLMSTMGSLILVLMVVTPKIRQEAVVKAAVATHHAADSRRAIQTKDAEVKKPAPYVPPVVEPPRETVDLNAKLKVELAELSHDAQEQKKVTEAKLEELGTAQASLAKNQAELDALEKRLEAILRAKRRLADSVAKKSDEGVAVESQLSSTAARLRTIRGEIARASTSYTFVAYDGVSGTTRRPILLECDHGHVTFLQEGVQLSTADLSGFSPQYNPVRAGAQALLDYWSTHSAPGDPRPYVLIVIRPSGTVAYYEARHLLERMKDAFGYELLPADQKLDVPPPVPEAAEACRKAVEKAIAERVDVFKELFANGTGLGGRKPGAAASDPFAKTLSGNGKTASPFDDLGNSPLGGPKGTGQNAADSGTATGSQPAGNGTPGGASVAQSATGNSGTGSSLTGFSGNGTSLGGPSNAGTIQGTVPGTGVSGDRQAGVMLSDTGPLATGRTSGEPGGTSVLGIGTPGANSSGVVRPGSGDGTGGGLLTGGPNGSGTPGGNPALGGSGFGPSSNAGPIGGNGFGPGGSQTAPGMVRTSGLNGPGSAGLGSAPQGVPVAGGSIPGTLGGGLPSLNGSNVGTPTPGSPGTLPGSPGTLPGSPGSSPGAPGTSPPGSPGMGGPGEGTPGSAEGSPASPSEFPPSIIPRAGGGDSSTLATGPDKLAIGHPTGGGPSGSGTETADGQGDSSSGQSDTAEAGAIPKSVAGGSQSGQFAPMQSGSIQSGSMQPGSSQFGSAPGGVGEGGTEQVASDSGAAASPQSGDAGSPSTPSSPPSDPSQVGGMPSFGSPPSGATAADDGGSPAGGENSPGGKPDNGASSLAASGDDYDAPSRRSQQTAYRWGISSPRASIGYEHDARIYIERNRIYVGSQPPISCGRGESRQKLSLAVIRALNREARNWGRPRENFYWVPSPKVVVLAGGLVQYERIEPTFERHALNWTVEYRTELLRPAPLPRLVTE